MNLVFANCSEEDIIYPLTVKEITEAWETDPKIYKLTSGPKYTRQLVENTQVLCTGTVMVLPAALQHRTISWYHYYLQHPGATHLKRHYMLQCSGMVCKIPSGNMSKTVIIHAK